MKNLNWKAIGVLVLWFILPQAVQGEHQQKTWIKAMSGKVEVLYLYESQWRPAKEQMTLKAGDKIQTLKGRVDIMMEDGSQLVLSENSNLELTSLKRSKNGVRSTFLKLWNGMVKAVVSKLDKASAFEVHMSNAVAAVKGTEFFCTIENGISRVVCKEGMVAVRDLKKIKEEILKEREEIICKGERLQEKHIIDHKDLEKLEEKIDRVIDLFDKKIDRVQLELRQEFFELHKDIREAIVRDEIAEKQYLAERLADGQLGKTLIDKHGYRVRVDEYLFRPKLDTIEFLNLTSRAAGPNKGITLFDVWTKYNQDLPDDYMEVAARTERQVEWGSPNEQPKKPDFFKIEHNVKQMSPSGNYFEMHTVLSQPTLYEAKMIVLTNIGDLQTGDLQTGDLQTGDLQTGDLQKKDLHNAFYKHFYLYGQDKVNSLIINGHVKVQHTEELKNNVPHYKLADDPYAYTDKGLMSGQISVRDFSAVQKEESWLQDGISVAPDVSEHILADGGKQLAITFSDRTRLSITHYVIDNHGRVKNWADVNKLSIIAPRLTRNLNLELVTEATEFNGQTIDTVIVPQHGESLFQD